MAKNSIKKEEATKEEVKEQRNFFYSLVLSKEGGRMILTNNPVPKCFKCGAPLKVGSWVFFCHLNKKVHCDTPKCKVKACALQWTTEEHEDTYGVLKIQHDEVKK